MINYLISCRLKPVVPILFLFVLFLWSCQPHPESKESSSLHKRQLEYAVYFTQHAPEYQALTIQGYNIAQRRLSAIIDASPETKKLAVVLDLDETVLDNSPYAAQQILDGFSYPDCWDAWCELAKASLIPGVKDFLAFADSLDVQLFYVSNRKSHLLEATRKNMQLHGLPQLDENHFYLRTAESSKQPRRQSIRDQGFEIVLLIGDNLADFSAVFDDKEIVNRQQSVLAFKEEFGSRFIVMPNVTYGSWESGLGLFDDVNQDSLRRSLLKGFNCKAKSE